MKKQASEMSQEEINRFFDATSALYFSIVAWHARRSGVDPRLPDLLQPTGDLPCVHRYDEHLVDEAEKFLLRLGMITEPDQTAD
ncbi:MAG: hypothetical protein AAF937_01420 [Planctomycetota bacterium]